MKYISGIYALNLPCSLETTGDWHQSSLDWNNIPYKESDNSIFSSWGIEKQKDRNVANTLRAILDLIEDGDLKYLIGFRDDFICNDKYDLTFFNMVIKLKNKNNWNDIDSLMFKEYKNKWSDFVRSYVQ